MYVLGINCFSHNSSAALIKDGVILSAIEEERLNREKHSSVFPRLAIRKCLEIACIRVQDVDQFTFHMKPWLQVTGNISYFLRFFPASLHLLSSTGGAGGAEGSFFSRLMLASGLGKLIQDEFGLARPPHVGFVEHHLSHAASSFFVSEFDEAAILTWDGRGESTSTLLAAGNGNRITKIREIRDPDSLGHLYASVTAYLGFRPFIDEWKVMGMSAYGKNTYVGAFKEILRLKNDGGYSLNVDYFQFHTHRAKSFWSPLFTSRFGAARKAAEPLEQRHFDIAFALQRAIEEAGVHVARHLYEKTRLPALCMTGGVSLNVLMNQKILEQTPFQKFFIQPIASDSGAALGSALYHYHQIKGGGRVSVFRSAYLGPEYSDDEIESVLREKKVPYRKSGSIEAEIAQHVFEGKIAGWFQGRMEAGPRALGNRSLIANPMDPGMKDRLNARIKKRETFRPFAPSILEERVEDFFEIPKNQKSPYMILSGNVRAEKRGIIPAVTHVDDTARVHTVSRDSNPKYWRLIHEFERISGVPVLLNTSFNENEPIVCSPEDALNCFLRTEIDVLGIGNFLVTKSQ
jgi:carbamoyltransferase